MAEMALRTLLVEDSEDDAVLVQRALKKGGYALAARRVDTREAMAAALREQDWDLVLSDYDMPAFSGPGALECLRESGRDLPFVLVSGKIGEEAAVAMMRRGARDYVAKLNLARLVPVVQRELAEAALRREQQETRRLLDASEERYATIFEAAEVSLWEEDLSACVAALERLRQEGVTDLSAHLDDHPGLIEELAASVRVNDVNPATLRLLAAPSKQALMEGLPRIFTPDSYRAFRAELIALWEGRERFVAESQHRTLDGRVVYVIISMPIPRTAEGLRHVPVSVVDLTARREAEQRLSDLARQQQLILDSAGEGIFGLDAEGRHTFVNPTAAQALGYAPADLIGRHSHATWHHHDALGHTYPPERCPIYATLRSGEPADGEEHFVRRDGSLFPVDFTSTPLLDDGSVAGAVVTFRDTTARKQAEESIRRANRALKTLSASNHALIRVRDQDRLLDQVTDIIVGTGGYRMAWVGRCEQDGGLAVLNVGGAGHDYLDRLAAGGGRVPAACIAGRAVAGGTIQLVRDIQAEPASAERTSALANGFRSAIAFPLPVQDRVFGALTIFSDHNDGFDGQEVALLEELASDLAFGLEVLHTRREHEQDRERIQRNLVDTVRILSLAIEKRDPYTAGHQQRVADLARAIAREMGLDESTAGGIYLGGLIHDIGKLYVPVEILSRPGRLSDTEFALVKQHPNVGVDIVSGVEFPWPLAEMIHQHHERLDGSGYPRGLRGEAILLEARILAVADVVEAIATHRPYRAALGLPTALDEIRGHRGTWFDPAVVDACGRVFDRGYRLVTAE